MKKDKHINISYKGYEMVLYGPAKDASYGGTFKCPGMNCVVGGKNLAQAKKDFEHFVDEHIDDIKNEKSKVEKVVEKKSLFKTTVEYMGILGTVEVDIKNKGFMGHILKAPSSYTYKGSNYNEFINNFHSKVDDYCKKTKDSSTKQYKGSFNVRISSKMHKDAVAYALQNNISLNKLVETAIKELIYE